MDRLRIPVDEYTTPCPLTVDRSASVADVLQLMRDHDVRHVPVMADGVPVGIVSDRDTRVVSGIPGGTQLQVGTIMSVDPYRIATGTPLEKVVLEMSRRKIGSALVMEGGEVGGIFTSTDALNALVEILRGDLP